MQTDFNELKVLLQSRIPILSVETHDEPGVVALFEAMSKDRQQPLFKWTVLDGFRRLDRDLGNQAFAKAARPSTRSDSKHKNAWHLFVL